MPQITLRAEGPQHRNVAALKARARWIFYSFGIGEGKACGRYIRFSLRANFDRISSSYAGRTKREDSAYFAAFRICFKTSNALTRSDASPVEICDAASSR
jgi:hypothetical protein